MQAAPGLTARVFDAATRQDHNRSCLMGNFDCVILARGSVEDARRETRRCLHEGMEGGGYVLVTGDEVPADAKLENSAGDGGDG